MALITVNAPTRRPRAEPVPPPPAPLSYERFCDLVAGSGLDLATVAGIYRQRFPTGPSSRDIDDAQRGRVWWDLLRHGAREG
jgi:hypothetical protein